jgi:hypothetical protein
VKARTRLPIAAVIVVFTALLLLAAPAGGVRSIHDRTPRGYRAAFAWLAEEGDVAPLDVALPDAAPLPPGASIVMTWPQARPLGGSDDLGPLLAHLGRGGRLVLLLDGATDRAPPVFLADVFDVSMIEDQPRPPIGWTDWSSWAEGRRQPIGPHGTLRTAEPRWHLECPADAEVLAATPDGRARACRRPFGPGEVVVIADATVWQNDHLARGDNLPFLRAMLGGRVVRFDEWRHEAPVATSGAPPHVPALFFAHLGALWLLGALTLSRRFGDPLPPPALPASSTARALHALATLHRGAGHAADAARRIATTLAARAARRGVPGDALPTPDVAGDTELLTYTRAAAEAQRAHRL